MGGANPQQSEAQTPSSSVNLKHSKKERLLWEISCNPREKERSAEKETGAGLEERHMNEALSVPAVIFHVSLWHSYSFRTAILFPGKSYSLRLLFLAG